MTETGGAMGNGLYREGLLGFAATSYKPQAASRKPKAKRG